MATIKTNDKIANRLFLLAGATCVLMGTDFNYYLGLGAFLIPLSIMCVIEDANEVSQS